jgi:hypothetical protein
VSTSRPLAPLAALAHVALSALAACSAASPGPVAVPVPAPRAVTHPPDPPPTWTYWEPLDATVHGKAVAPRLPLPESVLLAVDGADARWQALPAEVRAAVLTRGFAVVPRATPSARFGVTYLGLRTANVPYVVTLDALLWVTHVARDRALAAAEESALAPALEALLRRLETRLGSDAQSAPADLVAPFTLARGVVAVAHSLLSPAYIPPVDLARAVAEENRRIAAHEGPSVSPVLGVTVDYSEIVPRGAADASAARAAYARAAAWLGAAPFAFAARGEVDGAELAVAAARASARAALLVARLVAVDVDAEAGSAWQQWNALSELVGGASDDLSLRALLDAARGVGMDVRDDRAFVDVAKVDRLRHALVAGHAPLLDDGMAILGARVRRGVPTPARDFLRAATSVRIFPPRSAPDAQLFQALVFPSVGKLIAFDPLPATARDGIRALPRALDVAAWLGAPDARAALHDTGDDAYERYGATLEELSARRAAGGGRHDSVYASSLDALTTYVTPSAADPSQPWAGSPAWGRHRLEAILAGWTTLRHDALAFARFPLPTTPTSSPAPASPPSPPLAEPAPAFVEPHPEAIGKLLSLVRQTIRGLHALGHVPASSPANPLLDAAEHLLADAFAIARREADDEPLSADERAEVLTIPARLAALEDALVASNAADASLAIDVHTDLVSAHVLVEGCGDLDDVYFAFREPRTGRLLVAAGASSSHYEVTEPARDHASDTVWRARLHGSSPPPRAEYTRAFLVSPAEPEPEPPDASVTD